METLVNDTLALTSNGFDKIYYVSGDGISIVKHGGKFGYVDSIGKVIAQFIYDDVSRFSDGLGVATLEGKYIIIDKNGNQLKTFEHYVDAFSDNMARTWMNDKGGYINVNLEEVVPPIYDSNNNFSEGLAAVKKDGKWGYIDTSGNVVIPFQFSSADSFNEGLAGVRLNGKCGYIDKTGKEVIPFLYDSTDLFRGGFTFVKQEDKWAVISNDGTLLSKFVYDERETPENGFATVKKKKNYGVVNSLGKLAVPVKYYGALYAGEDLFAVLDSDLGWGYMNPKKELVVPFGYDSIDVFSEGLAVVKLDGKCGYMNSKGEIVIPMQYLEAKPFRFGVAPVRTDEGWYLISNPTNIEE